MALPRIIKNPGVKSVPKLKKKGYKKAGPKYGRNTYVAPKVAAAAAAPPPAPAGPYDAYPDWAKRQLTQLDNDAKFHQSYVADKVLPQAKAGLDSLAQFATTANDQYLAQLSGASQGAYNVAAGSTPLAASGGPGGIVASPNAYQTQASSELGRSLGSAATAIGQHSAMLGKTSPAIMGQGIIANLADYAKGLPLTYTTRRDEKMAEIDQFLQEMAMETAKFEETQRHNRVQEATSATNAEANVAIAFGRLGLDSSKEAYDQTRDTVAATSPAPYGYQRDPATGDLVRDPSVPSADSSAPSTKGTYTANQLRKEGFSPLPKGAGAKWKQKATVADDGSLWIKAAKPSGSTTKAKGRSAFNLSEDLLKKWRPSSGDGVEFRFDGNPKGAGTWLAQWVRENKAAFIKSGRKADIAKLKQVLSTVGGRPAAEALSILTRGYIDAAGNWK